MAKKTRKIKRNLSETRSNQYKIMSFDREFFALYDNSLNFFIAGSPEPGELGRSAEKEYVWDYKGNPYNIEIKEFLGLNYAKFNSASYETN